MKKLTTSAPGKLILLGEHAVVHKNSLGTYCPGIATAVNLRTKATITKGSSGYVEIISKNLGIQEKKSYRKITQIVDRLDRLREKENYTEIKNLASDNPLLPSFVTVEKIFQKYNRTPIRIEIESDVRKGMGSSAATFTAAGYGLLSYLGQHPPAYEIGEFANEGDMVCHGKASGIDAHTCAAGGFNEYRKDVGISGIASDMDISLLVVDTGTPARTANTVGYFNVLKETNPDEIMDILDELSALGKSGFDSLANNNFSKFSTIVENFYETLSRVDEIKPNGHADKAIFNVKQFKEIINEAKDRGLPAKPTGGWGGGVCIVLGKTETELKELIPVYEKMGYDAFPAEPEKDGARIESIKP